MYKIRHIPGADGVSQPTPSAIVSPEKQLEKLENSLDNYLEDCSKGYCKYDSKSVVKLKMEIFEFKKTMKTT